MSVITFHWSMNFTILCCYDRYHNSLLAYSSSSTLLPQHYFKYYNIVTKNIKYTWSRYAIFGEIQNCIWPAFQSNFFALQFHWHMHFLNLFWFISPDQTRTFKSRSLQDFVLFTFISKVFFNFFKESSVEKCAISI